MPSPPPPPVPIYGSAPDYYVPPGELVRELGPYEQPSLGMVPLYNQTQVRTFEAAAFYEADATVKRSASRQRSSSVSSSDTPAQHRSGSCRNCLKCEKKRTADRSCNCKADSRTRRNFCQCRDCRDGHCYRCTGARRSDSTNENASRHQHASRRHHSANHSYRHHTADHDSGDVTRRRDAYDSGEGRRRDGHESGEGRRRDGHESGDMRRRDGHDSGEGRRRDGHESGDMRRRDGHDRHEHDRRGHHHGGASGRSCRLCGLNKSDPACGRCSDCRSNGCSQVRDCLANGCSCVGRRARSSELSRRDRGRTASSDTGARRQLAESDDDFVLVFGKKVANKMLSPSQRADLIRSLKATLEKETGRRGDARHASRPEVRSRGRRSSPHNHSTPAAQPAVASDRHNGGHSRKTSSINQRQTSLQAKRSGNSQAQISSSQPIQVTQRSGPENREDEGKPLTTHHYFHCFPDLPSRKMNSFAPPLATYVHRLDESGVENDVEAVQYISRDVSANRGSRISRSRGVIGDHLRFSTCEVESSAEQTIGVH